jgi:hypothetical protein
LLTLHAEPPRNTIDFLFAKPRLRPPAAVGTGGAVDPGPHTPRGLEDALVDFVWLQSAPSFQELAKSEILIFFSGSQLADLNKIDSHKLSSIPASRLQHDIRRDKVKQFPVYSLRPPTKWE